MKQEEKRKQFGLRIIPELRKLAQRGADEEHRNFSNYIEYLIIQEAQKKGHWPGSAGEQPDPKATL